MDNANVLTRGCKRAFLCLLASVELVMVVAVPLHAQEWSKRYTVTIPIEGVSDDDVYASAINKIRIKAASDAGRYVQGDEVVVGNKYIKSIHVASSAVVSIRNVSKRIFKKGGLRNMQVAGTAYVDNRVLQQQIEAIRNNAQLARNLRHENDALAKIFLRLAVIDKQMKSVKGTADYLRLQAQQTSEEAAFRSLMDTSRAELGLKNLDDLYIKSKIKNINSQRKAADEREAALKEDVQAQSYNVRVIAWLKRNYYQRITSGTTIRLHTDGVSAGRIMKLKVQWDTHMGCPERSQIAKSLGYYFSNYTEENPDTLHAEYDPDAISHNLGEHERFKDFMGGCVSWPATWDLSSNMVYKFYQHVRGKKPKPKMPVGATPMGQVLISRAIDAYEINPYQDETLGYYGMLPVLGYIKSHFLKIDISFKLSGEPIYSFFIFDGKKLQEKGERVVYLQLPKDIKSVQGVVARVQMVM